MATRPERPGGPEDLVPEPPRVDRTGVGERLRQARHDAGLSQECVSQRLGRGFSVASLYRWEAGVDLPSFDRMTQLAQLYGTSLDWLAGRTECTVVFDCGKVVVDRDALQQIDALDEGHKGLGALPHELLRTPGLNCAWPVPRNPMLLDADAARTIESRLHAIYERLRAVSSSSVR